jgi:hypothetical protein
MDNHPQATAGVREALSQFQDGYTRRDPEQIAQFMHLFAPDEDLEVIGSGAIHPGQEEWCQGPEMAREMIESDWRYWGDVRLNIEGAHIHTQGEVAWLATSGTVTMKLDPGEAYQDYIDYMIEIAKRDNLNPQEKVLEIMRGSTNTLYEQSRGETFVWPLRFTAVLVFRDANWLFQQMQFSFPTTRYPDERILPL